MPAVTRYPAHRSLPPGQRLIRYGVLACLVSMVEGTVVPAGVPVNGPATSASPIVRQSPFTLVQQLTDLNQRLERDSQLPRLHAGIFMVEPDNGTYLDVDGRQPYAAASMIKIPVMVSLMTAVDRGRVNLDQWLTLRSDLLAGGSGSLQWSPVGTKIKVRDAAQLMIRHSDNTATNLIIDLLGGKAYLNREFSTWGLTSTHIENLLPDLDGTNKTSPFDLALILGKVDRGFLISEEMRKLMYQHMAHVRRTLLPVGLGPGATIVHKTGDIGSMVGDAGIVEAPNGPRYIVAVQVERPHNDRRANQLVRQVSRTIYEGLTGTVVSQPLTLPARSRVGHRRHRHQHHQARTARAPS